ncbi:hypothetical protein F5X68DRAFT_260411 [Plectosphaerella plurivora]|uniref:Zn(2)-C6 fungal-type domain-containing protein n=1 Tax=Plectosphaerella plurivora TaxID=936078 RepID=A0A9P8VG53_9PEZI|nr:hypothetical protein F5X68DRAFT_260411 [Plectosphaerella plurivora]
MGAATDASVTNRRVPACDPCRERKTKCNRAVPCSSCLTAKIPCHVSDARPEKRQRVLISSKYDEALESVDSRLQQVLEAVNSLQGAVNVQPRLNVVQHHHDFSSGFPDARQDGAANAYRGDSSFEAQSRALQRHPPQSPLTTTPFDSTTTSTFSEVLTWTSGTSTSVSPTTSAVPPPTSPHHEPYLTSRPLPPSDAVLRLLRLTQTEKQRFFLDVDLFDEAHFTDLCKQVFFAINPYSSHTWAIVNTGLYYLFHGLDVSRCAEIGLEASELGTIIDLLARNVQMAVDGFKICHDASLEACQSLALLSRGRKVLWYVFLMEKGLALTLGRPQVLHFYDISTDTSAHPNDVLGIPAKIAAAFFELALIEDEMIPQLFSASARHLDPRVRWERGQGFHERLGQIRLGLILRDTSADSPFNEASILVNVLAASVKTLVCWAAPGVEATTSGRRKACADCVDDARWILRNLEEEAGTRTRGWTLLLNIILCLAPFTPYLVLASHAATSKDTDDLLLLKRTRDMLSRAAPNSPIAQRILETCPGSPSSEETYSRPLHGSIEASDMVPQLPFITFSEHDKNP